MDAGNGLYIVTGASSGMGVALAEALYATRHHVIMACRNLSKAEPIRQRISRGEGGCIELLELDLSVPQSVNRFADTLIARRLPIAALINNAGSMTGDYRLTAWGAEQNASVNYFGTVALTLRLLPAMERGSRIINVLSCMHRFGRLHEGWMTPTPKRFSRFGSYSNSKLALLLFSATLRTAAMAEGIEVYAADPGIVSTSIMHFGRWFDPLVDRLFRPLIKTPEQGASTALALALGDIVDAHTALYWIGKHSKPLNKRITEHSYLPSLRIETVRIAELPWPTEAAMTLRYHSQTNSIT